MTERKTVRKTLAIASIIIILVLLSGCIGMEAKDQGNNVSKVSKVSASKVSASKGALINPNDTVAPSQVSYLIADRGPTWINWTWENPKDKDYSHAIIFIDGKFKKNVSSPVNYYNLTSLKSGTQYRIGIRTADINRNINPEWVNISISTLPKPVDLVPPDTIWYLEYTAGSTWVNWTWDNPADSDYSYANVWVDGKFASNVSKPKNYYLMKNLAPSSTHRISVRTVDRSKNMNPKSVDGVANTLP